MAALVEKEERAKNGQDQLFGFGTKTVFDALKDVFDVRFDDFIENLSACPLAAQETASLHEPQMLRGHRRGDLARLSQLGHRKLFVQEHLKHPQAVGVSQHTQALGGLAKRFKACQFGFGSGHFRGWFSGFGSRGRLRYFNISELR
jgi:hypothetical protein